VSLREIVGTLRRRWVVLAAGCLLTAIAGWVAIHPAPTYKAVAVITLRAPRTENTPNQFSDGRPSIALTGALISARMESRSGAERLRRDGVVGKYDLAPRNSGSSATPAYLIASVEVSVITHDGAAALRSVQTIVEQFKVELDTVQADWRVPGGDRITVAVLAPPGLIPMRVVKSRALLGVALLGGIGSVLVALWLERYLTRRNARGAAGGDAVRGI